MIRVAVVDVGSNAIRLVWQAVDIYGQIQDEGYHRYGLRLGTDAFSKGKLTRQTVQDLVAVFHEIAALMQSHQIDSYRAVATAAMRAVANQETVVKRIKRETGLELEVIDGRVESELSRTALVQAVGGVDGRTLLVDLGGGSLELERADGRYRMSTPMGTVRLMKRYPELAQPMSRQAILRMLDQVQADLRKEIGRKGPVAGAVGSGGNLDALSRICPGGQGIVPMVDLERLPVKLVSIAAMTTEERMRVFGLRADRADIIVPAALVVAALHNLFGASYLKVPGSGMREALLNQQTGIVFDIKSYARKIGLRSGFRKLRKIEKSIRYVFEKLAPSHKLHGPGLDVLLKAAVWVHASELGQSFSDVVVAEVEEAELVELALAVIVAKSKKSAQKHLSLIETKHHAAVTMLRGMHQFATRLVDVESDFWPQMYIQEGVLAVRVPQGSPFKRRHFGSCAETMGVALLFAHVVVDA